MILWRIDPFLGRDLKESNQYCNRTTVTFLYTRLMLLRQLASTSRQIGRVLIGCGARIEGRDIAGRPIFQTAVTERSIRNWEGNFTFVS
jgi:hypothetical protein